ncbi:MAG: response regulator [candidate division KSB1 bacterium]|nr:response regulator [candidate division KSB1 bacterium]MDZ7345498.1 response regulator [candidate division KSB1 bacterium]MDZ7371280.1 response regulator [candidate division KSB1 bacterium]
MTGMDLRPVEILLVEDNPGDIRLAQEGLREAKVLNNLHVVKDGEEALAFLYRQGQYQNAPRPNIILLDLNLPRRNGREVLAEIKKDESLRQIPVVILTSSKSEEDIAKSYDLHANSYVCKPVDLDKFFQILKAFEAFWLTVVELPSGDA